MRGSDRLREQLDAAIEAFAWDMAELYAQEVRRRRANRARPARVRFDEHCLPSNTNASCLVDGFARMAGSGKVPSDPPFLVVLACLELVVQTPHEPR